MSTRTRSTAMVNGSFVVFSVASVAAFTLTGAVGRGVTLTSLSAIIAIWVLRDLLRRRLAAGPTWWLLFGSFCFLTVHNLAWLVTVDVGGADLPPQPLTAIALGLGYLGLLGAALLMISPTVRRDLGGVLDAVTVGVGGASVLWITTLDPALVRLGASVGTRAYTVTLVVILSAITGVLLRAAVTSTAARTSLSYFLVGVLLTLAGNVLQVAIADPVTGHAPMWVSSVWALAYIAVWAAAAHPSSRAVSVLEPPLESRLTPGRISFLGVALAAGPLLAAVSDSTGHKVDLLTLGVSQLLLVALVLIRVSQLATAHADAARRLGILADLDPLTGLANRRAVDRHLEELAARVDASHALGAVVLFIDLDRFKFVNDGFGHHVGDDLLTAIAHRLSGCIRHGGGDLVGRLGGDEFILVLEGEPELVGPSVDRRVREAFSTPFRLSEITVEMTASIGMASIGRGETATADDLLTRADRAMYAHKRAASAEPGTSLLHGDAGRSTPRG